MAAVATAVTFQKMCVLHAVLQKPDIYEAMQGIWHEGMAILGRFDFFNPSAFLALSLYSQGIAEPATAEGQSAATFKEAFDSLYESLLGQGLAEPRVEPLTRARARAQEEAATYLQSWVEAGVQIRNNNPSRYPLASKVGRWLLKYVCDVKLLCKVGLVSIIASGIVTFKLVEAQLEHLWWVGMLAVIGLGVIVAAWHIKGLEISVPVAFET